MNIENWLSNLLTRVMGSYVTRSGAMGNESYVEGGLFGRKKQPTNQYNSTTGSQPSEKQYTTPAVDRQTSGYSPSPAVPTATPSQAQPSMADKYAFPTGDKPPVPPQYYPILEEIENGNIIASVLAQETGGYGYNARDPNTGEIYGWDTAKQKGLIGEAGEIGIAQIIPKWHWKDAGFPSEEAYADALYDPEFSIREASRILNNKFKLYGDWEKALSTWNKGANYPAEVLGRIGVKLQGR